MKKGIRIVSIIFILLFIFSIICPQIGLADFADVDYSDVKSNTDDSSTIIKTSKSVMGTVITIIRYVGFGVAVIMLTYIAIKYMMSSPEGKASYKKTAELFIFGAVLLFATSGILTIIQKFTTDFFGTSSGV